MQVWKGKRGRELRVRVGGLEAIGRGKELGVKRSRFGRKMEREKVKGSKFGGSRMGRREGKKDKV